MTALSLSAIYASKLPFQKRDRPERCWSLFSQGMMQESKQETSEEEVYKE